MSQEGLSRVEELYHAVLARPPNERAAFLESACGRDEALRREVRSLLGHRDAAEAILAEPAAEAETARVAVLPGTRLGPYEVVEHIGSGGMGEVYRARDTRLDRTVALKVLPKTLTEDRESLRRFEREARAISRLSHPHICTLYDVGRVDETDFLVMEHLEGGTLAERLERGALPLQQALELGVQIAQALEAAHRQGIVHRDLKPGNIAITRSGAKLLDFGLAKLHLPRTRTSGESNRAEEADGTARRGPLTRQGVVVGTPRYMAPEQLQAAEVDARTDIFALGAVLYEAVTGRRAFEGASQASLMAAILEREPPPLSERVPRSPPHLERVVGRCLAKDPDARWQSAADVAAELSWLREGLASPTGTERREAPRAPGRRALSWGLAVAAAVAIVFASAGFWRSPAPDARPVTRTSIQLGDGERLVTTFHQTPLALSPSGSHLAYLARPAAGGRHQIHVRALDSFDATALPGTEGAHDPFFSPDGRWIAFFAGGELKKVPVDGGAVVTLCPNPGADGGAWGADDTLIFPASARGLRRVSASGGIPEVVTTPDRSKGESVHVHPDILPGGRVVLYAQSTSTMTSWDDGRIMLRSVETGEEKLLVEGGSAPRYAASGHIVYARAGSLWAVRFDLDELAVSGLPVRVLDGVRTRRAVGDPAFALARNGTLVYLPGRTEERSLVWVDRQGVATPVIQEKGGYWKVAISPEGDRVAFASGWKNRSVWIYDLRRRTLARLTNEWFQGSPTWTPDGKRILFRSNATEPTSLFWAAADDRGGAPEQLLDADLVPTSLSPDGRVLALMRRDPSRGDWDILTYAMDGESPPREFLATEFDEPSPRFSPDGRWLAYASNRSGRQQIYITAFPGPGETLLVSREGGFQPRWAPSGRELFYRSGDRLMAVDIETTPALTAGTPRVLFSDRFVGFYDVAPDGRFVMIQEPEEEPATRVNVVFNWLEEVEAKMREAE